MRLLIVSHVSHYKHTEGYYAYTPYAKEIELWADLFPEVVIAAPCRTDTPPANTSLINRSNLWVAPQKEVGGENWRQKASIALALPTLAIGLSREMSTADAIHVRCPGNLGLLGAFMAPLFSRRLIAKFAGQWDGFPQEPWTVRLQRWILASRWWRGPVTVYGIAPGKSSRAVSFFSSILTAAQLSRARASCQAKCLIPPLTVTYTGRLTRSKNVDVLLRAIGGLKHEGVYLRALIVGEGPERGSLGALASDVGISDQVQFVDAVPAERVSEFLERSDIFVLASDTEGWPKSMTEAMAFGLVCIGSSRGLIPELLAEGRGLTICPRDVTGLMDLLRKIATAPEAYEGMRDRASEWAQRYSIERLRDALRTLMVKSWHLSEDGFSTTPNGRFVG